MIFLFLIDLNNLLDRFIVVLFFFGLDFVLSYRLKCIDEIYFEYFVYKIFFVEYEL